MQHQIAAHHGVGLLPDMAPAESASERRRALAFVGVCFISASVIATLFNIVFPRASDPTDTAAVLSMMAENQAIRQVSFLGITASIWILTAGMAVIASTTKSAPAMLWSRLGLAGLLIGAALFTAATGIGMVATGAATEWIAAGAGTASAEYAIAAALNHADDGLWFMAIIAFWGALGVMGIGIRDGELLPRWTGWTLIALGFGNAAVAGIPLAYAGMSASIVIVFAVLAQLTLLWALVAGIWMFRRSR